MVGFVVRYTILMPLRVLVCFIGVSIRIKSLIANWQNIQNLKIKTWCNYKLNHDFMKNKLNNFKQQHKKREFLEQTAKKY